jgi:uncharacterized protein (TIGR00288 family)
MIEERTKIAVFVDYDNIEIGVKSTLKREFDVAVVLDALKERGDIVAKFAYANWSRQEGATRQMAENAVQMVQRVPSPRGDKNGGDINLALDALEMAFTHPHVATFAIISGDSDFISLVNKLKEYGKTILVVGGKAFTSTILQKNCHEFISYEGLLDEPSQRPPRHERQQQQPQQQQPQQQSPAQQQPPPQGQQPPPPPQQQQPYRQQHRSRPAPLDLALAMPLVERALQVLERREVQPQLGLLKSTMLQLDPSFSEKTYGSGSFSDFVEKLKASGTVNVTGGEGRYIISRKTSAAPEKPALRADDALPRLRDVLETHRMEMDNGCLAEDLANLVKESHPDLDTKAYGFQEFTEFLNYAQDKGLVRLEQDEEKGVQVYLGAEFYPPAEPEVPEAPPSEEEEKQPTLEDEQPQPEVKKPTRRRAPRKKADGSAPKTRGTTRKPVSRRKKAEDALARFPMK